MFKKFGFLIPLLFCSTLLVAQEESVEARLRRLENENKKILSELEQSRSQNRKLSDKVTSLEAETDNLRDGGSELEELINSLGSAMDDPTWTTATKSGKPIQFYGYIRMDAYYNTARATDPIIPFAVLPEDSAANGDNDDQFAFDTRLTRIGIDIDAGTIGSARVMGKIETDFANFPSGTTESRPTPRIRLAYIHLNWGEWSVRVGQDWDIISPLYPAVHYELLLWGAGNLGDRRPMAQLIYETGEKSGTVFKFELAAGMTGAVDGADNDGVGGRTNLDGVDSGHPHAQMRLGLAFNSWVDDKRADIGVWGYIAGLETDTQFNGEDHFTAWTVGIDINLPLFESFAFMGEFWYGQGLSDVRGNMLMDINTATGEEIAGFGGWAEFHWQVTKTFRLAIGGSMDNPKDGDLNPGTSGEDRELNWTLYVSSKLDLGGGLYTGLDVIYWETEWALDGTGNMIRVNYWIQLNF